MTEKEKALADIEKARSLLGQHLSLARTEWNPRAMLQKSVEKHRWLWIGGASVAGLLAARMFFKKHDGKFERDNLDTSATKSRLNSLFFSPVLAVLRQAAFKEGTRFIKTQLSEHFSRHEDDPPRA